jgi:hypothetical protein
LPHQFFEGGGIAELSSPDEMSVIYSSRTHFFWMMASKL